MAKMSYKNRVALLITNIKFSHEKQRYGAEKDEENMERLLQSLGYEVVKCRNLTGKVLYSKEGRCSGCYGSNSSDGWTVCLLSGDRGSFN